MESYRRNFEKIKSSGMDRMLGYLDNSNSIIRDVSNQKPNSLERTTTSYEQTCVLSNAKGKNSYLDSQECVKIPYMILSDPTNLLFGLDGSVRNPMDVYRISTTNYDQKITKSRFLTDMSSNLKTLDEDINYETKTNLVSLAKKYTSFIDIDNITRPNDIDPLINPSVLPTVTQMISDENIDPGSYYMNMFEPATINPDPNVDELLMDLTIKDDYEFKLIPKVNVESKPESKPVDIKGSTIKPKVMDRETGIRNHKPVIYGLSSQDITLPINPTNIASATQTEDILGDRKELNANVKESSDNMADDKTNKFTHPRVNIGYRDTFDTTPKMMETCTRVNSLNSVVISSRGKVRLSKWFTPITHSDKVKTIQKITSIVLNRSPYQCNFIQWEDHKLVYKRYASLFFISCAEQDDNELLVLEFMHHYVEILDRYFGNVCELDIIYNYHKAYYIIDEILIGGDIHESSKKTVLRIIAAQDAMMEDNKGKNAMPTVK